jgi:molybdate transport system ATP-binding protein
MNRPLNLDAKHGKARVLVSLRDAEVIAGGRQLLRGITWQLHEGEHWGVVGTNGAGKTSFLKLVAGELSPPADRGLRIYDFGHGLQYDAVEAQTMTTLIGHELQDRYRRLKLNFTSREIIYSGIFRTDVPRREPTAAERARVDELIAALRLEDLADRPYLELSRGQQRRVLIARGLAFDPEILLLDEPAAGLDAATREVFHAAIAEVAKHTTLIYSAHEPADLPAPITHMLRIEAGRIVSAGPFTPAQAPATRTLPTKPAAAQPLASTVPAARPDTVPLIEIENGEVWIDDKAILSGLNWRLEEGEHWLVRGENGSGKSTFLRLLHGQHRSHVNGLISWPALGNPRNIWMLRRQVAWVSPELQAGYLYPSTVKACIASGFESSIGLMRRPTRTEAAWVDELIERFELSEMATRQLTSLSYGQMRRVLIVRALVNKPRILLLDEPWEGVDTPMLALIHRYLEQIIAQGTQLVCASHVARDLDCFTHELQIAAGRIIHSGPLHTPLDAREET